MAHCIHEHGCSPVKSRSVDQQTRRIRLFALTACLIVIASVLPAQETESDPSESEPPAPPSDISVTDIVAAQQFGETLAITEWLGPLAPIGLSPFFGITCLSGMSIWGEGWVSADNPMLGQHSPLNNQAVFWTFLILTFLTSAPRLTKVSKPLAQAVDQVEAWAGIITLVALKIALTASASDAETVPEIRMGSMSLTVDALLIVAAAVNVFIINAVKFFFETLIWITPFPTIDAIFECANKCVCGLLMMVYGLSPTLATVLNLVILSICLVIFRWAWRRQIFFRTMLVDAGWAMVSPPKTLPEPGLVVFPATEFGPFAARTRCVLYASESGWTLVQERFLRSDVSLELPNSGCQAQMDIGYFTNSIRITGQHSATLTFSRLHNHQLGQLAESLNISAAAAGAGADLSRAELKAELS